MKRALFLTTHPALGGAQKWTYNQIELLNKSYEVYLATGSQGWLSEVSEPWCAKVWIDKGIYSFSSLPYLFRLRQFVKDNNIDIVIASSANAGLYARLLKLLMPSVGVCYVSHGWSAIYRGHSLHRIIERGLSYLSDSIMVVSKSDYTKAVEILKISPSKLTLIENAIPPCKKSMKEIDHNRLDVIMVARFEIPKRQDILVEVAKVLPQIHFHFIGDGPTKDMLESQAPNNTTFWGELNSISEVMQRADVFVLLSDSEGMPLSVLEALGDEKPLLLSDIPSMQTFISENGFLTANNVKSVVASLIKMQKSDLVQMGKASKEIFDARFNLENKKQIYLDFYKSLLK